VIAELLMAFQLAADTPLTNPRDEARAQALMREIRCVVCENEPVSQSTADIAVDMRRVIREQVEQGQSDSAVRKFFSEKYGEFVLFRPSVTGAGLLLWAFPFVLLAGVGGWLAFGAFSKRRRDLKPLTDEGDRPAA
jgi:cytochrome c-type biogenesis protein CcmH